MSLRIVRRFSHARYEPHSLLKLTRTGSFVCKVSLAGVVALVDVLISTKRIGSYIKRKSMNCKPKKAGNPRTSGDGFCFHRGPRDQIKLHSLFEKRL